MTSRPSTSRVARFASVGAAGFVVQLAVAAALLHAHVSPVLATVVAIEAAILHNHAWHRRWTWRDRRAPSWSQSLWRAHLGSGSISLIAGPTIVAAVNGLVAPLVAQTIAVVACAAANYRVTDRWVMAGALLIALPTTTHAASEGDRTGQTFAARQAWERYGAAVDRAREGEITRAVAAWALDDDPTGTRTLAALRRGEIVVARRRLPNLETSDATIEHWQGSVLVRGVTLADIATRVRAPERYPQPADVAKLEVSHRTPEGHDLYLRLTRSLVVSATYDTWHRVRHVPRGPTRLDSVSEAFRVEAVGGEDRGFLWGMRSWWRFVVVPEGVVVTCESITLSRPVPFGLGLASRPFITRVARESMTSAVGTWRKPDPAHGDERR